MVLICCRVRVPYAPFLGNADDDPFKFFCNDTGLLCFAYGFTMQKALIDDTLKRSMKGGIYENVVAERLVKTDIALRF